MPMGQTATVQNVDRVNVYYNLLLFDLQFILLILKMQNFVKIYLCLLLHAKTTQHTLPIWMKLVTQIIYNLD